MKTLYSFTVKKAGSENLKLEEYRDKVVLIVNTASKCGFTPQYEGLENLYQKYKHRDFVIIGFPCNQFGAQESGSDSEIQQFCKMNYGVTFPVMSKIDVNGKNEDPLYTWLKSEKTGMLGLKNIKWNFTKFLIDQKGRVIKRYASAVVPEKIDGDIEKLLKKK